jgi:hypothetical protein
MVHEEQYRRGSIEEQTVHERCETVLS